MNVRDRLAGQQHVLDEIEWPRWVLDGATAFAVSLAALAIWEQLARPGESRAAGWAAALIGVSVVPWIVMKILRWEPRDGVLFAVAVLAPLAVLNVAGERRDIASLGSDDPQLSLMILVFLIGQMACHTTPAAIAVTLAGAVGTLVGRTVASGDGTDFVPWFVAFVLATAGGFALRANFVSMERFRQAQLELARKAVTDERRRIARDVHDVVAHTLSVTMLHLTAARMAVERHPDKALEALDEAERQGRSGMADIRRTVGLLRADDEPGAGAAPALPSIDELTALIDSYRAAGVPVSLEVESPVGPTHGDAAAASPAMSPAVGMALYRVAQEALANSAKHGVGEARVRLCVDEDRASITVRNMCDSSHPNGEAGSGLSGMRERVTSLGGTFTAGMVNGVPRVDGADGTSGRWWEVTASLPTGASR